VLVVVPAHRVPALPGDAQDDQGDAQADERVGDRGADGDNDRRGDDRERHLGVGGGVVAVGDERGAVEPVAGALADLRGREVAQVADGASGGEHPQVRRR
jgi:hypothetical protein